MRALIVEDETTLREQLVNELRTQGFAIDETGDGEEGLYLALHMPIDIAIIDLGLPGRDGLSLIRALRQQDRTYPVLILTARDRWQDKVDGLEAGADDYLTKPFHIEELLARTRALLRRTGGWSDSVMHFERMSINTRTQQVSVDEKLIELTAYEYRVLVYLATQDGSVISKSTLLDHLYDEDTDRDPNVLEVFIRRLRQKLDADKTLNPIETLRGRGYRLALSRKQEQSSETSPETSPESPSDST
ncbi:response regulator transcription factor [Granulosicoccus antarcticus]|uniref:Virulence transcriptional regulatory protein PhoP n=1 Tax=Granulosicoccus antarcticus IMCC3135 TaxID=1192854 RepID=A0A2Z2NUM3_9GAMM|nr:response regulator transcription factor [Granulosicoccus antarcticus]ASJ75019.1 Virulence transcriptional regulatory protein PhoP [Granulosicoccus antarcticus IMCC3135]